MLAIAVPRSKTSGTARLLYKALSKTALHLVTNSGTDRKPETFRKFRYIPETPTNYTYIPLSESAVLVL